MTTRGFAYLGFVTIRGLLDLSTLTTTKVVYNRNMKHFRVEGPRLPERWPFVKRKHVKPNAPCVLKRQADTKNRLPACVKSTLYLKHQLPNKTKTPHTTAQKLPHLEHPRSHSLRLMLLQDDEKRIQVNPLHDDASTEDRYHPSQELHSLGASAITRYYDWYRVLRRNTLRCR